MYDTRRRVRHSTYYYYYYTLLTHLLRKERGGRETRLDCKNAATLLTMWNKSTTIINGTNSYGGDIGITDYDRK